VKEELEELEKKKASLERKIELLEEEIKVFSSFIPSEELEEFKKLKDKFNGLVFADISTGSCEGCGMTYSSAEFKELLSRLEPGKTKCPYCGRFVYKK
jgi:predicted  nucleic acid-binding Zn-ribbon protein